MSVKNKLTQEYLKECLTYDPGTGIFTWNVRPLNHFKNEGSAVTWNARFSHKICGSPNNGGYIHIKICNILYKSHRLAFLYMEGYLPENMVDHMDRDPTNNKWNNLREVSSICNGQNCKVYKNNTSGVNGVSFDKRKDKWFAQLRINKKNKHIGYFDNLEDAVRARYQEEIDNPLWACSINSSAGEYLKKKGLI